MTTQEIYIYEKAKLEATIVKLQSVLEFINLSDNQNSQNIEFITILNDDLVKAINFIDIVNYPPTPKAMGWASWVKAPSNEGNIP